MFRTTFADALFRSWLSVNFGFWAMLPRPGQRSDEVEGQECFERPLLMLYFAPGSQLISVAGPCCLDRANEATKSKDSFK